jgi:hypothetical protein
MLWCGRAPRVNLEAGVSVIMVWRTVIALIFMVVVIGAGVGWFKHMQPAPNPALQQMCKEIREGKIMGGRYGGPSDPETIKASGCSQVEAAKLKPL